jgi:hypothetical protein
VADRLAEATESCLGQGVQQILTLREVPPRGRVAHAHLSSEVPQRELGDASLAQAALRGLQESRAQAAVVVAVPVGLRVHRPTIAAV